LFRSNQTAAISHNEWKRINEQKCKSADILRQKSAQKRAEAHKMMEKEEAETIARQEKADHRLKERLEETLFWTEEVEAELNRWDDEKFKLAELRNCLVHAHGQTGRPARVADKCIRLREGRIGEDKVLDTVEENLILEMENVRLWQMRLKTAIEQIEFQQSQNQLTIRSLSRDLGVKSRAVSIDSTCTQLTNSNSRLTKHTGADLVASPPSWEEATKSKISASMETREWSQQLRADVETLVRTACTDLTRQWKRTNTEFKDHTENLRHTLTKMQERLDTTVAEINEQGSEMDRLKVAIGGKSAPLKVAQTRLNMRTQRTRRGRNAWTEARTDSPQAALVGEVTTILDSLQVLNNHLRKAESSHRSLLATKAKLEYDIHVKTNSLVIDCNKCMAGRQVYPMKLQGAWQKVLMQMLKETEKNNNRSLKSSRSDMIETNQR